MAAVHLSFEIVADVGQCFAGDGEDLCIGDVYDVYLRGNIMAVQQLKAQWGCLDNSTEQFGIHGKNDFCICTIQMWIGKDAGIRDYTERFVGEKAADAKALVPGTEVFAI